MESEARARGWLDIPDAHWRAFFGAQADHYMEQLERVRAGRACSFHWPAFFLGFAWMAYRRMFVVAVLAFCLTALLASIELVLEMLIGFGPEVVTIIDRAVNIASAFLVGAFANRVYLWHAARTIREEMTKGPFHLEEVVSANVARRGGTSWLAVLALFGALVLLAIGAVMLEDGF